MSKNQTTLRAAVIGLGFIGAGDQVSGDAIGQQVANLDGTHSSALASHPQVRLIAGSSRDEGRRLRFKHRHQGVKTYDKWQDLLAAGKLDIVSIATNSPYHAEITVACAEAGVRAILCEKPIATRLSDADRAIAACRQHGTLLAVNHSRRWHPLWRAVRDEIRSGAIGQVDHAMVHWTTGRLGNVGTHVFDALRMLLDTDAEAISGALDPTLLPDCRGKQYRDPGGWGVIAFASGVKAFINGAQDSQLPLVVRVVGSLGQVTIRGNEATIEPWTGPARAIRPVSDGANSLSRAVADLVQCLVNGGRPASTGEDGLAALEMIIAFHVSHRLHGQWVAMPITGADREMEILIG